jgi:general secretion pathway protein D
MNKIYKYLKSSNFIAHIFLLTLFITLPLAGQTISEKKSGLQKATGGAELDPQAQAFLAKVNLDISLKENELRQLYAQVNELHLRCATDEEFQLLLARINTVRNEIKCIESQWQEMATQGNQTEEYALWHQPEVTIEELIMDYGSQDYVYLIPSDIGMKKISLSSKIPIPRASWEEMLELVLSQSGIGIRQLNPYLRELYFIKLSESLVKGIIYNRNELELFPQDARIAFLLKPDPTDVRRTYLFLSKFITLGSTFLQLLGRDILIIGPTSEIQDLLKLYDFIVSNQCGKEYRLIGLTKTKAEDMARILGLVFDQVLDGSEPIQKDGTADVELRDINSLKIIVLSGMSQALFLVGTREEIDRAEEMVRELEERFCGAREKVIQWYTVQHSDPEELAEILQKIYLVMVRERIGFLPPDGTCDDGNNQVASQDVAVNVVPPEPPPPPQAYYQDAFYQDGAIAVDPAPVPLIPPPRERIVNRDRDNFIVDIKTGALVMVVEQDILPKILEVIRRLDVPKKMVQIEVLLVERRVANKNDFGLNLLRLGAAASMTNLSSLTFNNFSMAGSLFNTGITEFILSRAGHNGKGAFDLIYKFLLTQNEVQINSCPSVTTINQTPAKIVIAEERSINTGIFEIPALSGSVALKDSFTRAQYGTTLLITPTIHMRDESGEELFECDPNRKYKNYITLETDVNFDTIDPDSDVTRPIIIRRNIHNEVLIPDGETLILGGLRRKNTQDSKQMLPFLGEIPGLGKLFSQTNMRDESTEMFIFITPTVIADPCEDIAKLRYEQLCKRPGDIPEFLITLQVAQDAERNELFKEYLQMLFGRPPPHLYETHSVCDCAPNAMEGEYDGR